MNKETVSEIGSNFKVSTPWTDMPYGYAATEAFTQRAQLKSMGTQMIANSLSLMYQFFYTEVKGDGSVGRGSLRVATNQYLGCLYVV